MLLLGLSYVPFCLVLFQHCLLSALLWLHSYSTSSVFKAFIYLVVLGSKGKSCMNLFLWIGRWGVEMPGAGSQKEVQHVVQKQLLFMSKEVFRSLCSAQEEMSTWDKAIINNIWKPFCCLGQKWWNWELLALVLTVKDGSLLWSGKELEIFIVILHFLASL